MFKRKSDKWIWAVLGVSAFMNLVLIGLVVALAFSFWIKLESMDSVYKRCAVGIRWVETYKHQGKIIAVDSDALRDLEKEVMEQNARGRK